MGDVSVGLMVNLMFLHISQNISRSRKLQSHATTLGYCEINIRFIELKQDGWLTYITRLS